MSKKGFTLIELLIVVAVIGILATIAVPKMQNYIIKSKIAGLLASLHAIKTDRALDKIKYQGTHFNPDDPGTFKLDEFVNSEGSGGSVIIDSCILLQIAIPNIQSGDDEASIYFSRGLFSADSCPAYEFYVLYLKETKLSTDLIFNLYIRYRNFETGMQGMHSMK